MDQVPTARDLMATSLVTLRPDMPLHEAIDLLLKNKISGAPVVDEEGRLVGVLSEKDCLRMFASRAFERGPGSTVSQYMSKDLYSIDPDSDLFRIADIFLQNPFRRLPVLENGKLIGQISRRDILMGSKEIWGESPVKKPWTDSTYLTDQIKAALKTPTPDKPDTSG